VFYIQHVIWACIIAGLKAGHFNALTATSKGEEEGWAESTLVQFPAGPLAAAKVEQGLWHELWQLPDAKRITRTTNLVMHQPLQQVPVAIFGQCPLFAPALLWLPICLKDDILSDNPSSPYHYPELQTAAGQLVPTHFIFITQCRRNVQWVAGPLVHYPDA
jgi:hypothetical protein